MSKKYKKYTVSREEYPTRIVSDGKKGVLKIGKKDAQKDIEKQLKRPLAEGTKCRKCGGNLVFYEPKPPQDLPLLKE